MKSGGGDHFFRFRYLCKVMRLMKNQGNMTPPKRYSKLPTNWTQRNGDIGFALLRIQNGSTYST